MRRRTLALALLIPLATGCSTLRKSKRCPCPASAPTPRVLHVQPLPGGDGKTYVVVPHSSARPAAPVPEKIGLPKPKPLDLKFSGPIEPLTAAGPTDSSDYVLPPVVTSKSSTLPVSAHAVDYSWVEGELVAADAGRGWALRFAGPDAAFGGRIPLRGVVGTIDGLKAGQHVRVEGNLDGGLLTANAVWAIDPRP